MTAAAPSSVIASDSDAIQEPKKPLLHCIAGNDERPHSRGRFCPSFVKHHPLERRAQGMPGASSAPAALRAKSESTQA
jgi:hypothetical protein